MDREQASKELKKAQRELDDAIMIVARCADELSANADCGYAGSADESYYVEPEDMVELRNALAHWKACTQKFLEAVDAVGEVNYAAATEPKPEPEPLPLTDNLHLQSARRAWATQIAEEGRTEEYGENFEHALLAFDTDLKAFARNGAGR